MIEEIIKVGGRAHKLFYIINGNGKEYAVIKYPYFLVYNLHPMMGKEAQLKIADYITDFTNTMLPEMIEQ